MSRPWLHRARGATLAGGLVLLLGATGFFLLRYRVYAVPTASMTPLITPGDRVVVDTWSQDAARGDVVLLDGENLLVKRVAAIGGDGRAGRSPPPPTLIGVRYLPSAVRGLRRRDSRRRRSLR